LQRELTDKLFQRFNYSEDPKNLSLEDFKRRYTSGLEKIRFDKMYNNFYDRWNISVFDIEKIPNESNNLGIKSLEYIYISENTEMALNYSGMGYDIGLLESIKRKEIRIESFEYDGKKYHAKESEKLQENLMKIHKNLFEKLKRLDIQIYQFFLLNAKLKGEESELKEKYRGYFKIIDNDKDNIELYFDMINSMQFISKFLNYEKIKKNMAEFKTKEKKFKAKCENLIKDEICSNSMSAERIRKVENYLSKDWEYFKHPNYNDEAIKILEESIYNFYEISSRLPTIYLKDLLDYQISLLSD
jgi:hypothetical protein